ncbi:MAG: MFS transporter [Pirellulales bacterium]
MALHHVDTPDSPLSPRSGPWYQDMTRYHWFVLTVAALGWLFDCLDQQLFTLARPTAMRDLLGVPAGDPSIAEWGGYSTSIFILGWATGGLIFGALGDRIGRAKTMMITILVYSACTGLSSLSVSVWDFAFYRFITGLGVGGEFAVGVALVAEVMPESARARALSLLQALSAVGNISAAFIGWGLAPLEESGVSAWRVMFVIGALPALLALVIRRRLKEPERWQAAQGESSVEKKRGSYAVMFSDPQWRRAAVTGLFLAIPGVIGLWGIGFFSGDLTRVVFRQAVAKDKFEAALAASKDDARTATLTKLYDWEQKLMPKDKRDPLSEAEQAIAKEMEGQISSRLTFWQSLTLLMQQLGAAAGMYSFGWLAQRMGRKPAFFIAYTAAMFTTALVFWKLDDPTDFWMLIVMGFFQLSLFALYAIYFPEIFPTYLRSTGTSFCYNVGRYVAAFGPIVFGLLTSRVFTGADYPPPLNWRYAGMSMSLVFIIGIITLFFARETKGQPLPE